MCNALLYLNGCAVKKMVTIKLVHYLLLHMPLHMDVGILVAMSAVTLRG